MLKHRGFPSRLTGTDFQFTIRRANKAGATPLVARKRYADRRATDRAADTAFFAALLEQFGDAPFERGNLDAGRLSWLFGREVVPAEQPFDPASYEALLKLDLAVARRSFPHVFETFEEVEDEPADWDDEAWDDETRDGDDWDDADDADDDDDDDEDDADDADEPDGTGEGQA